MEDINMLVTDFPSSQIHSNPFNRVNLKYLRAIFLNDFFSQISVKLLIN